MPRSTAKSEETGQKILEAALALFRRQGFDSATMRDIAAAAGVATGAAYYYYPSKDAIVMDFYRRASAGMQPALEEAVAGARGLEERLRELIRVKLDHFAPNRAVLRALLRNGADPMQTTKEGDTPVELALRFSHGEVADLLKRARQSGEAPAPAGPAPKAAPKPA